jgi:hypothetical protein
MNPAVSAIESAIEELDRLRTIIKKKLETQIRSTDEKAILKATAFAWFYTHHPKTSSVAAQVDLSSISDKYKDLLAAGDRAPSRKKVLETIKSLRDLLIGIRSVTVSAPTAAPHTADDPPSFAKLITDSRMQNILKARWCECAKCLAADAPLAATVMMGGLLEAILLARINREPNKASVFTCTSAPRDKAGKTKPLNEWGLKNYIDVSHEHSWISVSVRDVGEVLRDYRNYVHPYKQLSNDVHLKNADAELFGEITKNISRQILASV